MKNRLFLLVIWWLILGIGLVACGGGGGPAAPSQAPAATGDALRGQKLYTATCAPCHGPAGEGVTGLGKDLTRSEFVAGKSDAELVEFIKVGRSIGDPLNTTGVAMLPKGGNAALTDQDLVDIVAYMRTLQK